MNHGIFTLIKNSKFYLILFLLFFLTSCLYALLGDSLSDSFANPYASFWLHVFFINFTFMGDSLFVVCLSLVLIFYFRKKKAGLSVLTAFILTELVIQVIKNMTANQGPTVFFEAGQTVFNSSNSIANVISGHTAIAFALFTVLALLIQKRTVQCCLLIAASFLAYTRIYLSNDAFAAVLPAALVGTSAGLVAVYHVYYVVKRGRKLNALSGLSGAKNSQQRLQPVSGN